MRIVIKVFSTSGCRWEFITDNMKKSILFIVVLAMLAVYHSSVAAITPATVDTDTIETTDPPKVVIGYIFGNHGRLPDPFLLTHLNYAFGHVTDTFDGVRLNSDERLREVMTLKQQNPDLKILVSIGGWGSGRFSEMAADENYRLSFARDCKRLVDEFGLDGIDIDWEYPTSDAAGISAAPEDRANFTLLMRDIRAEIGTDKLLTLATVANAGLDYIDFRAIDPYIDLVNMMTYDMDNSGQKHHSGLYRSPLSAHITTHEATDSHLTAGVPLSKLVMGVPFYGRGVPEIRGYTDYRNLVALEGYERRWDEVAMAPYLVDPETGRTVAVYDDARSLAIKTEYIKERGMRGIMYWAFDDDTDDLELSKTIYYGLYPEKRPDVSSFLGSHTPMQTGVIKAQTVIVKQDFDFAAGQLTLALAETEAAIAADPAGTAEKEARRGRRPLVSPRTIDENGNLVTVSSRDWTSGFFPGELWFMYEYTGREQWKQAAMRHTASIEREKENGGTHDMGFKIYCSFGNGYRLTGNEEYAGVMLEAARTLVTRFKPGAGVIRSWDHNTDKWASPVIIDNMMNLELLFWASKHSGDPLFRDIAVSHAETTMRNHFRDDFSTYHVVDYDTLSGAVLKRNTHQGFSHESTWSRGQSWAIYGYTMTYRETGRNEFLEQAVRSADFFFGNPRLPEDMLPYWDFDAPEIPNEPRDVSAAAVTASALYELSMYDKERGQVWRARADRIVENLSANYLASPGQARGFLLLHSTGSGAHDSEVDVPLVYADYYFLEALLRKQKLERTGNVFGPHTFE